MLAMSCYSCSVAALYFAFAARKHLDTLAVMSNESSIPPDFSTTSGTGVFSATAAYVFDSSCISFFDSTYFDETTSVSSFGDKVSNFSPFSSFLGFSASRLVDSQIKQYSKSIQLIINS